jgi:hypothetical protein
VIPESILDDGILGEQCHARLVVLKMATHLRYRKCEITFHFGNS